MESRFDELLAGLDDNFKDRLNSLFSFFYSLDLGRIISLVNNLDDGSEAANVVADYKSDGGKFAKFVQ